MVVLFSVNVTEFPANFASLNCRHISSFSFMLARHFSSFWNPAAPVQPSTVGPWVRVHNTQANRSAKLQDFFIGKLSHRLRLPLAPAKKDLRSAANQRNGPCFIS
jgi:hypothetical protein